MSLDQPPSNSHVDNKQDDDIAFLQKLKRSVSEAALSSRSGNLDSYQDSRSDDSTEHFLPRSEARLGQDKRYDSLKSRQSFTSQVDSSLLQVHAKDMHDLGGKYRRAADTLNDLDSLDEFDGVNGFLSAVGSSSSVSDVYRSFVDMDEPQDQVFSPPLLMDAVIMFDSYEDLLAPLSDTEAALMEH